MKKITDCFKGRTAVIGNKHSKEEMYPNGKEVEPKNCQWCNP